MAPFRINRKSQPPHPEPPPDQDPVRDDEESDTADVVPIEAGTSEAAQISDQLLRMRADFDNFRRRNAGARAEAAEETRRTMLSRLLPIYENFLRARDAGASSPEAAPFIAGFDGIRMQFEQYLEDEGVAEIPAAAGLKFDPVVHEAVGMVPAAGGKPGSIAQLVSRGFRLGERVLKPASVLVFEDEHDS